MTRIIQTKLNIPRLQSNHFSRDHLLNKINASNNGSLILVSAPAGYGKTTLVSEWISKKDGRYAWYSLNEEDNNVITFIYYLVESFKSIDSSIGDDALSEVEMIDTIGIENVLISLLNDLVRIEEDVTIILDDYHLIHNSDIQSGVNFILEHLPHNANLLVITRNHEQLPISKLRAKNKLMMITQEDLTMDFNEIEIFLDDYLNKNLTTREVEAILNKTEGWITSLHLFAMSLLKQEDPNAFIESFSGSEIFAFDYLLEEVFNQQSKDIKKFLMVTALFNRFNSSIASYMLETSLEDTEEMLGSVLSSNLFVVSLDDDNVWYRYHHLFQEFLQRKFYEIRLEESLVLDIFDYASVWFKEQGFIDEAINNAINAKKYDFAVSMIETEWYMMDQKLESSVWVEWVKKIPEEHISNRPVIQLGYAWALLDRGIVHDVELYLTNAEQLFNEYEKGNKDIIVESVECKKRFLSILYAAKAYINVIKQNEELALDYIMKAIDEEELEYIYEKRTVTTIYGLSLYSIGRIDEAIEVINHNVTSTPMKMQLSLGNGRFLIAKGKIQEAKEHYKKAIDLLDNELDMCQLVKASCLHDLALLYYYQGENETAYKYLDKSQIVGEKYSVRTFKYYYNKIKALILQSDYKYDEALSHLNTAEEFIVSSALIDAESLDAIRTNIYIKQEKTSLVLSYIEKHNVLPESISFLDEFSYIVLIKALLYKFKHLKDKTALLYAEEILEVLQSQFSSNSRSTRMVEGKILETRINLLKKYNRTASDSLQEAIQLASIEKYIQPFVEAVEDLKMLLTDATLDWVQKEFVLNIIRHINISKKKKDQVINPDKNKQLINPLSKRELEVLHLIKQGCTNDEIAKTLFLAISTVKNYNQSLFGKLEVKNRTEAILKASDLGII